ncbi:MAG: preprotein translocase subunit SecA [Dehalococcoidia bacterium]|nr:preprotein translocase subunit SecA [Dehalococcoidia bacterium]
MFTGILKGLVDSNERALKALRPMVEEVNDLEPAFQALSNDQLKEKTQELRARLEQGETLDDLMPEAFAAVREAAKRTIGQRHFDVQLMGGAVLHQGRIAEMKTGEGKTLVATLPLYLNALEGKGAHLVTVNDYLAKRDTQWMGPIFHLLGLSVGCLQHDASHLLDPEIEGENPSLKHLRPVRRQDAYGADITYGTNNEFGFDYLRDNMVADASQMVQRELHYAIVDEVDNILVDEARTPLIISGPAQQSTKLYSTLSKTVPRLSPEADFKLDEKERSVVLTDEGISKMERWLNVGNLYDPSNYALTHYVENALKAHVLFLKDRDYVVKDGEVVIVDEFTGRLMPGRRYSEGLHQAIEAKENVRVQRESITYATITLQNYFRLYSKLAGMTGTAATEAEEFWKIYKLDVMAIPTHQTMIRRDENDLIYKTEKAKFQAVADQIDELHKQGRPVLVGTTSIEKSERISEVLKRRGIPHQVLNAKQHEKEAVIVAQAGSLGGVTVATNMAGRGTDIVLGGSPDGRSPEEWEEAHKKVVELGGLYILGTERHEARRIDNQLRGRAGRQGDPGTSRFFVSLDDDLMRRFGGERISGLMDRFGMEESVPIQAGLVSKAIEQSQVKVEAFNFDIRKHLVDYDDVVNLHRDVIYGERRKILSGADLKANVQDMMHGEIQALVGKYIGKRDRQDWNLDSLEADLLTIMPIPPELGKEELPSLEPAEIQDALLAHADALYEQREKDLGAELMRTLERAVMLRVIDSLWLEHLTVMQNLRESIGLEAYGQRDPLVMYKKEAHETFDELLTNVQHDIVHTIFHVLPVQDGATAPAGVTHRQATKAAATSAVSRPSVMASVLGSGRSAAGDGAKKVGRNEPCPCGSGKKYKRCHGAAA